MRAARRRVGAAGQSTGSSGSRRAPGPDRVGDARAVRRRRPRDFRFNAILNEEFCATGTVGIGLWWPERHPAPLPPQPDQRRAEAALAAAVRLRRANHRDRDVRAGRRLRPREPAHHRQARRRPLRLNGTKTFISNGLLADLVVVARRTDPNAAKPHQGISLLWSRPALRVSPAAASWTRSARRPPTPPSSSSTTSGSPSRTCSARSSAGFHHLMGNLPRERLGIASTPSPQARARDRADHSATSSDRKAFGNPIGTFQVNRHALAQMTIETERHADLRRRLHHGRQRGRADRRRGRRREVRGRPRRSGRSWTAACSCTAATAT